MKILLSSRFILIFSAFLLFACGEVDDKQAVESAKKYIENNQIREASLELKNALQANPKNAEARYLLGKISLMVGDMGSATKEFRKAQEAGWDEAQSQIGLMHVLVSSRDYKKVLDDIQIKDIYSKADRAELYGLKAFSEAASGYTGLAKVTLKQGAELDKDAYHVLKTSIQLALTGANTDAATKQLKHAFSIYENNAELLLISAYIAMRNNNNEVAAEQFQKIISLEPEYMVTFTGRKARLGFARLEISNKNLEQAEKLLATLFRRNANDPELNYIGGLLSFEQGNLDIAEERLLKVLKVAPEHAKLLLLFGAVKFSQKDYEQAAYYIGKHLQLKPENMGARKLLGRTYILLGQQKEAQATLQTGLQVSDDDAELLALLGLSQLKGGDIESGITDLEKAVVAAPDSKALRRTLAKAYLSAGETEKAINELNKIVAEGGNRIEAEVMIVTAYLREKQYDKAINVVLEIHERWPQDTTVMSLVGNVFAASGDTAEARKYFNKALKIEPENFQVIMLLARLEEIEGRQEQAAALYEKLTKDYSDSIDPLLALARLAEQQKDNKKMIFWLEQASDKAPSDLRPKIVLAEYYLQAKELAKAEVLVKEAAEISENNPTVLLIKGKMLMQQKLFNEAVSPLTELVTRNPEMVLARSLLGETYLYLQKTDDARRQLELALEKEPYSVPALLVLARVEHATGQYARGLEHVEKILKVKPDFYQIYSLGGDISMSAKNYVAANNYYQKSMSVKPDAATVIKSAKAYTLMAQHKKAIKLYKDWLGNNPDDVQIRQVLGSTYLSNGKNKEAIQAFEAVYARQPEDLVALNNLAWLYSLENDKRALGFAEKAYKAKPEDNGIKDTYGWILVQQGEVDKGRQMLEQVMMSLSGVAEVRYHYAVALMKTGDEEKAREFFTELLDSNVQFEGREHVKKLMK